MTHATQLLPLPTWLTRYQVILILLLALSITWFLLDLQTYAGAFSFWSAVRYSLLINLWVWPAGWIGAMVWQILGRKARVRKFVAGISILGLLAFLFLTTLKLAPINSQLELIRSASMVELLLGNRQQSLELLVTRTAVPSLVELTTLEQSSELMPPISYGLIGSVVLLLVWLLLATQAKNARKRLIYIALGVLHLLIPDHNLLLLFLIGVLITHTISGRTLVLSINNRQVLLPTLLSLLIGLPIAYSATAVSPQLLLTLPGAHRLLYTEEQMINLSLEIEPEWGMVHRFAADRTLLWIRAITNEATLEQEQARLLAEDPSASPDDLEEAVARQTAQLVMRSLEHAQTTSRSELRMIGLIQLSARYRLLATQNPDALQWYRATLLAIIQQNPRFSPAYDQLAETYREENPDHATQIMRQKP